ncbi:YncE family protein [Arthrobacter sp. SLBN-112]|uniref:Vgb family protein n=1 Tax=Arthrobacter sp. SLBN-112 TaxID=2768452 RepID=UPI002811B322|nr:YncE family protein [Arthrobacter sp. SLBN-112]
MTGVNPKGMALSADGTLFVEGSALDDQQEKLVVIPKGSSAVARTITLSADAHLIAAGADGTVFVPNPFLGTVSVIPPGADAPSREVAVGRTPKEVAVAQDGTAYVTNQDSGTVSVIAPGAGTVSRTIDVRKTPDSAGAPHGIAIGPDGTAYVTNITSDDVAVIKAGASAVAYRVPVPGGPKEITVGPDSTVYVLFEASSLSVIAPGETSARRGQPTLRNPGHLALAPNGSVLVTNTADKSVSVFPAQDLSIPALAAVKAQAVQAQTKTTDPTAQASSDHTGTNMSYLPVIVGTVGAAILIGAAALILASRRRRHS